MQSSKGAKRKKLTKMEFVQIKTNHFINATNYGEAIRCPFALALNDHFDLTNCSCSLAVPVTKKFKEPKFWKVSQMFAHVSLLPIQVSLVYSQILAHCFFASMAQVHQVNGNMMKMEFSADIMG